MLVANLIDHLAPIMQQFVEIQQIMNAEDREIERIEEARSKLFQNAFIASCDEDGIKRFEKPLGIAPDPEERLEARKMRVYALWNSTLPYTIKGLKRQLDTICGEGKYSIGGSLENYELNICTHLTTPKDAETALTLIEKMIPENMDVSFSNEIENEIRGKVYNSGVIAKSIERTIA